MPKNKLVFPITLAVIATVIGTSALMYAQSAKAAAVTTNVTTPADGYIRMHPPHMMPSAVGTVTSITGNIITLTNKDTKIYTIDATNAKILKGSDSPTPTAPQTISLSDIKIGDTLIVTGTTTDTTVVATTIFDGKMPAFGHHRFRGDKGMMGPHVDGTITAIAGNTITVADDDDGDVVTTYNVDTTTAKFITGGRDAQTSGTIASVKVGDKVMIHGTVSGTTVTATDVLYGMQLHYPGDAQREQTQ